jgi:membrane protein
MAEERAVTGNASVDWRSPDAVKELGKDLYHEVQRDKATIFAAAAAYHTVFAIPPLITLIVLGAALLDRVSNVDVVGNLREVISERAPADTQDLLNTVVDNAVANVSGSGLSIGILTTAAIALWSGSNAIGSYITAFNQAYDVREGRPFVKKKLVSFMLTVMLVLFINLAFALLVFGQRIGRWIADLIGAGSAFDEVWNLARWPFAIAAIALFLAILYYLGPNVDQSFRWISPGSVAGTILWLIATAAFGIYLRFSDPGSAYGVVGSLLVLLFFLYITAIVFILGAEINAILAKRYDAEMQHQLATKPEAEEKARREAREFRRRRESAQGTS